MACIERLCCIASFVMKSTRDEDFTVNDANELQTILWQFEKEILK